MSSTPCIHKQNKTLLTYGVKLGERRGNNKVTEIILEASTTVPKHIMTMQSQQKELRVAQALPEVRQIGPTSYMLLHALLLDSPSLRPILGMPYGSHLHPSSHAPFEGIFSYIWSSSQAHYSLSIKNSKEKRVEHPKVE